jgi:phage terminase large subunit GpA-like protein
MMPAAQPLSSAEIYRQAAQSAARPDAALKVSEWADKYRMLTLRSSPEPGPWRTSRVPFLRDIMDDLSPSSRVRIVVFMKGAQIGGTECGNNWTGFNIHLAPGPMMAVQPTTDMAKRNSKQRIAPLIEDSNVLKELVKEARSRDSGNTVLAKEFPGGILVMVGANSPRGLRSMSARYLFLDEVDGYPGDVGGEGDPCDLAMARTTNFPRSKIFITSTPVISGRSRIERFYEESDQRQYWVPCPHCREMLVLQFAQLRWPKGQPHKAQYFCEACAKPIENHAKEWMLPRGEWHAQIADADPKVHGYHISSLYSPVGWLSWAQVAAKREAAGSDGEKVQVFTNTILGLPWAEEGEVPDADRLYERREGYRIGRVPVGGLLLTCGVDVQIRRLECEIVAWGRDKHSWSVDYRVFEGETNQPEVWAQVAKLLDEDFPTDYGGPPMRIRRMAVDSGFNTMAVYDWIRQQQRSRVMAVKGESRVPSVIGLPNLIEIGPQGKRIRYGIRLWPVNSSIAKEELYRWLRGRVPDTSRGEKWPTGFCHFPEYSKEYFEQLCAEQLVTKTVAGRRTTNWVKIRDRNEALDTRVYARAAAASMRIETWTDARWDELEASLRKDPRLAPAPAGSGAGRSLSQTPMPQFKPFRAREDFLE